MEGEAIQLTLTRSEALVLFEWLAASESEQGYRIPDEVQQQVLGNLESMLEKSLWEIHSPDYTRVLASAKSDILTASE